MLSYRGVEVRRANRRRWSTRSTRRTSSCGSRRLETNDPVGFASDLLETRVLEPEPEARVVINPRAGTIVISGDVEIGDVIVSHKNVVVEATATPTGSFAPIDVDQSNTPKLQQLVISSIR